MAKPAIIDINTLLQAGINPKTGLPMKFGRSKKVLKEDTKKFLQQLAKHIYLWREVGVEHDVETEIKKAIYQKAYVENLPIFYQPELKRYVSIVNDYLEFMAA